MSSADDAEVWPGSWRTLGATADADGVNFAVWAAGADRVELCLFESEGNSDGTDGSASREARLTLPAVHHGIHHGYVPGVRPGTAYGFRAHGRWDPALGFRYNPAKLLVDPYARAIDGELDPSGPVFGHAPPEDDLTLDPRDSAAYVPKSIVVDPADLDSYDWVDDAPPRTALADTVIYEAHVRGLTKCHPAVPAALRGTYAGVGHPAVIEHLTGLGVTAIELLPVHHFADEPAVVAHGLTNYWGYNTLGFFAPHAAYSASGGRGQQVREFKDMVRALHTAGLEVILDVVYNHTAEGDEYGPTLCLRGLDNHAYYRLREAGRRYRDFTGTGNTLNTEHSQTLRLVMDSLRYWVQEMHVDGFRFDLAPALTRSRRSLAMMGGFLATVGQDPILAQVKLIAEPWDVGDGGYRLGQFPTRWAEWNDRYRDTVRDFWRGSAGGVRDLAYRLSGSSDLYRDDARMPSASINFVTCHDGFTLRDLVSYDYKHNEANREGGRDGTNNNHSWNSGVEGESADELIHSLRARQMRNLAATVLLSTGVPMWLAGDEFGRTQRGNNNAYCQDNEMTWIDWTLADQNRGLLGFVRALLALRRAHPALRRRHFFEGTAAKPGGPKDVAWLSAHGGEMTNAEWYDSNLRTLGMLIAGDALHESNRQGQRLLDDSFLLWLHAGDESVTATVPPVPIADPPAEPSGSPSWVLELTTDGSGAHLAPQPVGTTIMLPARSVVALRAATARLGTH